MGFHDLDEATDEDLSNSYKLLDFYIGGLDNLYYLFDPVFGLPPNLLSGEDALVGEVMLDAWTSFAKSGDPAPPSSTITWPPIMEKGELRFLNISGPTPSMDTS